MGANLLSIYAGQSFSHGVASSQRVSLRVIDAEALVQDAMLLSAVVPEIESSQQVKYGNTNINVDVTGSTAEYPDVLNFELAYGRMFTTGDDESRKRVAVLGYAIPELLNANPQALLQQTIMVKGLPFEIVGVFAEKGSSGVVLKPGRTGLDPDSDRPLPRLRYRPTTSNQRGGGGRCSD